MVLSDILKQAIKDAVNNGEKQYDIAERMGVSLRTVNGIVAEMKKNGTYVDRKMHVPDTQKLITRKTQKGGEKKVEQVKAEPVTRQTYIPSLPHIDRHGYDANRLLEIQLENLEVEKRLYDQAVMAGDNISVLHQKNIQKILDTLGKWYGMENLYAQPKAETITVENDARLEEAKRIIDSNPKLRKAISNDG